MNAIAIKEYLPQRQEILYAFAGVVFVIYSWSIRGFLYQLSSLRLYHTLGEILAIFSYLMAFAFIESLIVMGCLLVVCLLLPRRWFREGFAYKSFITILVTGIAMIILNNYLFSLNHAMPALNIIYPGAGVTLAFLFSLIWASQTTPKLQQLLLAIQERMQIFLYFYVPIGIIGWVVLILRNIR